MEIGSCFEARKLVTPTFQLFVNDPSRVRAPKLPEVLHKEIGFGIGPSEHFERSGFDPGNPQAMTCPIEISTQRAG